MYLQQVEVALVDRLIHLQGDNFHTMKDIIYGEQSCLQQKYFDVKNLQKVQDCSSCQFPDNASKV